MDELAITAAVIDEDLAAADAVEQPRVEAFSRDHVEAIRLAGGTKEDARSYFEHAFGTQKIRRNGTLVSAVDLLMDDLDSYGEWA